MPNKGGALVALAEAQAGRGPDECWPWPRYVMKATGYGQTTHEGQPWLAHRLAYTLAVGPIPEDSEECRLPSIEHDCHTSDASCPGGPTCLHRRCVNPAHLVVTSRAANAMLGGSPQAVKARLTMCERGLHPLSGDNLGMNTHGGVRAPSRYCRACQNAKRRAARVRVS